MDEYTRSSKRLLYRVLYPEDLDAFYEVHRHDEVGKWLLTGRGKTKEETLAKIYLYQKSFKERGFGTWGVFEKASGKLIGQAGLEDTSKNKPGIQYAFMPSAWNKGYGSESLAFIFEYGFTEAKMEVIIAGVFEDNTHSRHVVEKAGMKYLGIDDFSGHIMCLYAITKEEWQNEKI